jgi:hypothetical protein
MCRQQGHTTASRIGEVAPIVLALIFLALIAVLLVIASESKPVPRKIDCPVPMGYWDEESGVMTERMPGDGTEFPSGYKL